MLWLIPYRALFFLFMPSAGRPAQRATPPRDARAWVLLLGDHGTGRRRSAVARGERGREPRRRAYPAVAGHWGCAGGGQRDRGDLADVGRGLSVHRARPGAAGGAWNRRHEFHRVLAVFPLSLPVPAVALMLLKERFGAQAPEDAHSLVGGRKRHIRARHLSTRSPSIVASPARFADRGDSAARGTLFGLPRDLVRAAAFRSSRERRWSADAREHDAGHSPHRLRGTGRARRAGGGADHVWSRSSESTAKWRSLSGWSSGCASSSGACRRSSWQWVEGRRLRAA